jgi:SAM-dependent methyltransferase
MLNRLKYLVTGFQSRRKAQANGLPGIEFDRFGRELALRQILSDRRFDYSIISGLANPVSCVRYFEFAYAGSIIKKQLQLNNRIESVLDISSPRLFPLWMSEKAGLSVTMLNPDQLDLDMSRHISGFLKKNGVISFTDNVDATKLCFDDDSFDMVTSISVIEHVPGDGDSLMMAELARVIRPGGQIILSFPVRPKFVNEYRDKNLYNRKQDSENGKYFFQRYYDSDSIRDRILSCPGIIEAERQYWAETPAGWFEDYEKKWISEGLKQTSRDPELMSKHFKCTGTVHPADCMGICCMTLIVNKQAQADI